MSNVDAIAPEWLQGHTVVLSVLLHAYARKLEGRRKILVYCLAAFVFSAAYLIKFNSLLFAIPLIAFLVFDRESRRFKTAQLAGSVAIFMVVFYHYKSTGTRQLTYDHAWVLTATLPENYASASPERLGPNSLRWAALLRITPQEYFRAGGVDHISVAPPADVKQKYEEQVSILSRMSRDEVIRLVKDNPLGPNYNHWDAVVPLYYYYGLERTDALGIEVFKESLRTHTGFHIKKMANSLATFFVSGLKAIRTFPTFADSLGYRFLAPDFSSNFLGTSKIVPPPGVSTPYFLEYYNPQETVSFYGVMIVGVVNSWTSASLVYLLLNVATLFGMFRLKSKLERITGISLMATLAIFIAASSILLGFRQKEIIALTPSYVLLVSIGLLNAASLTRNAVLSARSHGAVSDARNS
jgi:hypothetical protein